MKSLRQHGLMLKLFIVAVAVVTLFWLYMDSLEGPVNQSNLCVLFKNHPDWYWASQHAQEKWGVPISLQMAIIHKESHFRSSIRPKRELLLGFIPWEHISSARGYSQALDATWRSYLHSRHIRSASRADFSNAVDFIGWYFADLHRVVKISYEDPLRIYLAYHEGAGGYLRGSYRHKPWLIAVARGVAKQTQRYHAQLVLCQKTLPEKPWWRFW